LVSPPPVLPTRGIQVLSLFLPVQKRLLYHGKKWGALLDIILWPSKRSGVFQFSRAPKRSRNDSVRHRVLLEFESGTTADVVTDVRPLQRRYKDTSTMLPPCFHRTLRGIKAIASQMRLVEDNEIKRMLDEVDRREGEEEEEKIKALEESM
jgi:hypothetical protein